MKWKDKEANKNRYERRKGKFKNNKKQPKHKHVRLDDNNRHDPRFEDEY